VARGPWFCHRGVSSINLDEVSYAKFA
jgi:hypothetical protein